MVVGRAGGVGAAIAATAASYEGDSRAVLVPLGSRQRGLQSCGYKDLNFQWSGISIFSRGVLARPANSLRRSKAIVQCSTSGWPCRESFRRPATNNTYVTGRKRDGSYGRAKAYISPPAPTDFSERESEEEEELHPGSPSRSPVEGEALGGLKKTPGPCKAPVLSGGFVLTLLGKEGGRLATALLALLAGTACTLVMPKFSGRFFETVSGIRPGPLHTLLLQLSLVYFLEPVCTLLYVTSLVSAWENCMAQMRAKVFECLLRQKVEFYDNHSVGELTSVLSTEMGAVEKMVTDNVSRDRGLRSVAEVLGTLCILFTLSRELAPVFAVLMIAISASVGLYKRATMPVFRKYSVAQGETISCAGETFGAIRTVRSFSGEHLQLTQFQRHVETARAAGSALGRLKAGNEAMTRTAVYLCLLLVYVLGGRKVQAGLLPVGTMVAFIGYTFTLTFAVQGLVNTLGDLRSVLGAVERINALLAGRTEEEDGKREEAGPWPAVVPARQPTSTTDICQLAWSGDLVMEGVSFSYPYRPGAKVLNDLWLRLPRGKVTALVGPSGAGKSTVVQLLSRFYEPTAGRVTLAGQDVQIFDKDMWARAVSLVNQEPVLFNMSVRDNIAYGLASVAADLSSVSDEAIQAAAKAALAHDFVQQLPQGYDTIVGERGGLLSGGQRQRVAIARALLKDAPILILDEATSALDSVSERLVQQALNRLMEGRTTLVIAHRLSTVQSADQIAVLSAGQVLELGSHKTLLTQPGGAYAELVASQELVFQS
eukprot:TRINITY_DN6394_c0_g1_i1.p1 TRINITY_DN6394_c0_g1~~TRINITY_DN6394_c0_g1_i1.p1  ORF type:complete len:768 (+),score=139.04 TRINITY_DN6394_c0_g1_i1:207-2510(+)